MLITGLGIGVCLQGLLRKPDIEHVTVVEKSACVIALVAGHYQAMFGPERMTFVCADAFAWLPPGVAAGTEAAVVSPARSPLYDYAWHDIWPIAIGAYWPQHESLYNHYAPFVDHQDSWRAEWMKKQWQLECRKGKRRA